ncbi:hypothetical protein ACFOOM_09675 [Streptomyces echinoruber]|jgi:hypothetical protein|uniref:Uncharacterized protein n=1 Tax=Streptomyces echinoruber TaxID=68898 RepID=A0A918RKZ9_9ACTN|nr:hypothetical protein [Streptomyces echinoruber]GHA02227.1 hypothetical protein GCM10010389_47020 [Streptomyces echinoruber]
MNSTPQVATAEISDAELDLVAGGSTIDATAGVPGSLTAAACAGVFTSVSPEGVGVGVHAEAGVQH